VVGVDRHRGIGKEHLEADHHDTPDRHES
jgi:hypothetical protein